MKVEKINRVILMVKDIDRACSVLGDLFGTKFSPPTENKGIDMKVSISPIGFELVSPLTPDGASARTLAQRGEGVMVVALEVDNLEKATAEMEARKIRVVTKMTSPEGKLTEAILHPKDVFGVMLALVDHHFTPGA